MKQYLFTTIFKNGYNPCDKAPDDMFTYDIIAPPPKYLHHQYDIKILQVLFYSEFSLETENRILMDSLWGDFPWQVSYITMEGKSSVRKQWLNLL